MGYNLADSPLRKGAKNQTKSVTHKVTKGRMQGAAAVLRAFCAMGRWTNRRESINYDADRTIRLVSPLALHLSHPARPLA